MTTDRPSEQSRREAWERLSEKQFKALQRVRFYHEGTSVKWASASTLCSTPGVMGSLVRRGLVNSCQQREHPIGERPFFYGLYQINAAGLRALSKPEDTP